MTITLTTTITCDACGLDVADEAVELAAHRRSPSAGGATVLAQLHPGCVAGFDLGAFVDTAPALPAPPPPPAPVDGATPA